MEQKNLEMSREKQIEGMAIIIARNLYGIDDPDIDYVPSARKASEELFDTGYHKQEWISVDDRLPEERELVFVYDTDTECVRWAVYSSTAEIWTDKRLTHWMPLPEAPKMKGGVEK